MLTLGLVGLIAGGSAAIAGVVGGLAEGAFGEVFSTADAEAVSMDTGDVLMDTENGCVDSLEIGADSGNPMPPPLPDGPEWQMKNDDGCPDM